VLRAENARVIDAFIGAHSDVQPHAFELPAGRRAGAGWQILPGEGGLDGMFYAVLVKAV
jgi:16S rRNA (cytosine967-C5)-methyltransferase